MFKNIIATALLMVFSICSHAAQNPTEESLKALCRDINNTMQTCTDDAGKQAVFDSHTAAWAKANDLNRITAQQVEMLFQYGGYSLDGYLRRWLEPTLASLAANDCDFAFLSWRYMPENDNFSHTPKETAALLLFLNHADLQKHLDANEGHAEDVLSAMATMKDANWQTPGFADGVLRLLRCKLSDKAVLNESVKAFNSVALAEGVDASYREMIRVACLDNFKSCLATLTNDRHKKNCEQKITYLEGAFACGRLVGNKAPQLHFIRGFKQQADSVARVEIKSLDDFSGKVVVLDFWGTKCVPCIKSIPEIAELQQHYEGKDVIILGVTSLQGYFFDQPNHRTIQCRNNPEKELACFPGYMKAMGITWHIAISEEDVMNTDFGVLAIPHVTIIDRHGNVRHNAVNANNEEKIKLIDELLSE